LAVKRQRGRDNSVSTNRPETVNFVWMPLPRSGAPSPGQPTQVGAIEKVGRLTLTESATVAATESAGATSAKTASASTSRARHTASKNNQTILIRPPVWPQTNTVALVLSQQICPRISPRLRMPRAGTINGALDPGKGICHQVGLSYPHQVSPSAR